MFYFSILFLIGLIVSGTGEILPTCSDMDIHLPLSVMSSKDAIQSERKCSNLADAGYCIKHGELIGKHCQYSVFAIRDQMKKLDIGHTKIRFCSDIVPFLDILEALYVGSEEIYGPVFSIKSELRYCNPIFINLFSWSAVKGLVVDFFPTSTMITDINKRQHEALKIVTGALFWLYVSHKEGKLRLPYGKFMDTLLPSFCTGYTNITETGIDCDAFITEYFEVLLPKVIPMLTQIIQKGPQNERDLISDLFTVFEFFLANNSFGITEETVFTKLWNVVCNIEEFEFVKLLAEYVDYELKCDKLLSTAKASDCYEPVENMEITANDDFETLRTEVVAYMDQIKTCQDAIQLLGCSSPAMRAYFYPCQREWYRKCSTRTYPSYKDSLAMFAMKVKYRYLALDAEELCCGIPAAIAARTITREAEKSSTPETTRSETKEPVILIEARQEAVELFVGDQNEQTVRGTEEDFFSDDDVDIDDGAVSSSQTFAILETKTQTSPTSNAFDLETLQTLLMSFIIFMVVLH